MRAGGRTLSETGTFGSLARIHARPREQKRGPWLAWRRATPPEESGVRERSESRANIDSDASSIPVRAPPSSPEQQPSRASPAQSPSLPVISLGQWTSRQLALWLGSGEARVGSRVGIDQSELNRRGVSSPRSRPCLRQMGLARSQTERSTDLAVQVTASGKLGRLGV